MKQELEKHIEKAKSRKNAIKRFFLRLKQRPPKDLDRQFRDLHEQAFEKIDCLDCANCCKTTSPIFYDKDVERISSELKMRPADFSEYYLKIDSEGDQVLKNSPCPFLMEDNRCRIYSVRPKACREYPHTNRKRMHQILDITQANTKVCPAVASMVEGLQLVVCND